ncbi:hypothetical protein [Zoogloea sp.]|uniref:hypothetical protein n=1 Tax=Zoogloea sp. TaxID=49181 RepID=UPI0035B2B500
MGKDKPGRSAGLVFSARVADAPLSSLRQVAVFADGAESLVLQGMAVFIPAGISFAE